MPIVTIIQQPSTNKIVAAYRPIVFLVRARKTDNTLFPDVVYCDVYVNNVFYRTLEKTQYVSSNPNNSDGFGIGSDFRFDIQQPCQELFDKKIPDNGGTSIQSLSNSIKTIFCRFRSSGTNSNGFLVSENTVPVQGTSKFPPVSGTGTQSNTFDVVNATLQHLNNQDLEAHLNYFKNGVWGNDVFPLSHRPSSYTIGKNQSDYLSIVSKTKTPTSLRIKFKNKGQNTFFDKTASLIPVCIPVTFPTNLIGNGQVGVAYLEGFQLSGTPPFTFVPVNLPSWLTGSINGTTLTLSGTPTASAQNVTVEFSVSNCGNSTASFIQTINVLPAQVNPCLITISNISITSQDDNNGGISYTATWTNTNGTPIGVEVEVSIDGGTTWITPQTGALTNGNSIGYGNFNSANSNAGISHILRLKAVCTGNQLGTASTQSFTYVPTGTNWGLCYEFTIDSTNVLENTLWVEYTDENDDIIGGQINTLLAQDMGNNYLRYVICSKTEPVFRMSQNGSQIEVLFTVTQLGPCNQQGNCL